MRVIEIENEFHRRHFDLFREMNHPHFSICAPVEVGPWVARAKAAGCRLTSSFAYLLARVANDIPEFRQRIRDGQIVEHELVHPSFTIGTEVEDAFSFCEVPFHADIAVFLARAEERIAALRAAPSLDDEPGRDDYLFMSSLPWVAFTSVTHAMGYHPHDSVPRMVWGKLFEQGGRQLMPLSVQAHHALVDGIHVGRFFERLEALCLAPDPTWDPAGQFPLD